MKVITLFFLVLLLAGCQAVPLPTIAPQANVPIPPPPTSPVTPAGMVTLATITPTPPAGAYLLFAPKGIPAGVVSAIDQAIQQSPGRFAWTSDEGAAHVHLALNSGEPLATWVYALAAPFATVADEADLADVQAAWQGSGPQPLLLGKDDAQTLALWWQGTPPVTDQERGTLQIVPAGELISRLWDSRPAWTILPFDALTPELKVLRLAGQSPLDKEFDPAGYPLTLNVGLTGDSQAVAELRALWPGRVTNRDPQQLTYVAMTGVTALVRATAYQMELNGILYPGEEVGPVLRAADIAHISNEVAFAADCPPPDPVGGTTFCSSTSYLDLLTDIGTDVVELTGNHVNDWGADNLSATLDMYDAAGMTYFGGGRDLAEAEQPLTLTHNGNRIAFVGCNPVGPSYAWASTFAAGSQPCDYAALYDQIASLREEGYLVIATQQYLEIYDYAPTGQQALDFQALAEAGAAAVSGSQGHHAQGFAFHEGAFIHYGLGNLFFDQMDALGTRQTFVDNYVIYQGRLLSVDLWTGLIENYARPRLMTSDERGQLLRATFAASGW